MERSPLLGSDATDTIDSRCNVEREKRTARSDDYPLGSVDNATCYLQSGGSSASGKRVTKKLVSACALAFAFMLFEIVGGSLAHSIAIMSDAAHMFSDVLSFVVSVYCMRLIGMEATATYSFGYHRAETIGALVSVLIVCVITGGLVVEAIQRLANPEPIDGKLMFIVSTAGIGFNLLLLCTLGHDHHVHLGGGSCGGHGHGGGCGGNSHGGSRHEAPAELSTVRVRALPDAGHKHSLRESAGDQHKCSGHGHDHAHDHSHGEGGNHHDDGGCDHGHDGNENQRHADEHGRSLPCEAAHDHSEYHDHSHSNPPDRSDGHCHGHSHTAEDFQNQNLRGALIHVLGDILQSVGVAIAGAIIWATDGDPKWLWVDPMCTFIFALSVVYVTKTLIVDVTKDLMEAVPEEVDLEVLLEHMKAVTGVSGVHDLHVWRIGTGKVILTAHIDVDHIVEPYRTIKNVEEVIGACGISHSTVQICGARENQPSTAVATQSC